MPVHSIYTLSGLSIEHDQDVSEAELKSEVESLRQMGCVVMVVTFTGGLSKLTAQDDCADMSRGVTPTQFKRKAKDIAESLGCAISFKGYDAK